MSLDHPLEIGLLVPWDDQEAQRVAPDRLVLCMRYLELLGTILAATFADESDHSSLVLAMACEAGRDLLDALIHLAKEGLVLRQALLPAIHASLILRDRCDETASRFLRPDGGHRRLMQRSAERDRRCARTLEHGFGDRAA